MCAVLLILVRWVQMAGSDGGLTFKIWQCRADGAGQMAGKQMPSGWCLLVVRGATAAEDQAMALDF